MRCAARIRILPECGAGDGGRDDGSLPGLPHVTAISAIATTAITAPSACTLVRRSCVRKRAQSTVNAG